MAAATITKVALPHDSVGYNLTDSADFTTLVAGSGNGVQFTQEDDLFVLLKNDTGGSATYTLKVPASSKLTTYGGAITSPTKVVATGKTVVLRLESLFRDGTTGYATIECDVAGKVLVLDP